MGKGKSLAQIKIGRDTYSIRATEHAVERMAQRHVDAYVVTGNVLALGPEKLADLKATSEDAIIIDTRTNTAVVVTVEKQTIKVVTVIDKSNVWVKDGTRIERIS